MRLLYIFPRTTPDPVLRAAEHARRLTILRAAAGPATEVDLRELVDAPPAIESVRDGYAVAPGIIALAESLQHEYDAMIVGCLSLAFTDAGDALQERLGVPVVNPLRVAVRTCELLVGSWLAPSKRFAARSAAEQVEVSV
jgi:allantoin racemase